jgi:hypothetical protein
MGTPQADGAHSRPGHLADISLVFSAVRPAQSADVTDSYASRATTLARQLHARTRRESSIVVTVDRVMFQRTNN